MTDFGEIIFGTPVQLSLDNCEYYKNGFRIINFAIQIISSLMEFSFNHIFLNVNRF